MSPVFRLIYASRMSAEVEADLPRSVRAILDTSVRNNAKAKLTGLLVVYRGRFMQVLEGSEEAVDERFRAIRHDRRHSDFRVVLRAQAPARVFPHWSMCAQDLSATDQAILEALDYKDNFDPDSWPDHVFMRLFRAVSSIHARSLDVTYDDTRRRIAA